MVFDENTSCTCGRDPSLVVVDSSEVKENVMLVLSTAKAAPRLRAE
jgi:hypothetical protein